MNVSFDSNNADKENDYSSDYSTTICISHERANSTGKSEVLGSFIRYKTKENLINAILQQADREDFMKTLGFPNRKNW
jgi:hypothetical protein